jgi:hypothetical protein
MDKAKDVMYPINQQRRGVVVGSLPGYSTLSTNPLVDALADNTVTPPDEQVCFRIDFPNWLASLCNHRGSIAEDRMVGERTLKVADKHGISSVRSTSLRPLQSAPLHPGTAMIQGCEKDSKPTS